MFCHMSSFVDIEYAVLSCFDRYRTQFYVFLKSYFTVLFYFVMYMLGCI